MLRISIEIEGEQVAMTTTPGVAITPASPQMSTAPGAQEGAAPSWQSLAVASGANDAGPAPTVGPAMADVLDAPIPLTGDAATMSMLNGQSAGAAPGSMIEGAPDVIEEGE